LGENTNEEFCFVGDFIKNYILFLYFIFFNHNNEITHNKSQQKYIFKTKFTNTNFTIHLNISQQEGIFHMVKRSLQRLLSWTRKTIEVEKSGKKDTARIREKTRSRQ
jgi:hypothetical protein